MLHTTHTVRVILIYIALCVALVQSSDDRCNSLASAVHLKKKYVIGGWTSHCQPHYVSYESCLKLLLHSECNAAYYNNKVCHLLDRNQTGVEFLENEKFEGDFTYGMYVKKLVPELDECRDDREGYSPVKLSFSAVDEFQKCVAQPSSADGMFSPPSTSAFSKLPHVNVVISATSSWVDRNPSEFDKVREHWSCYAKAHDYLFSLNLLPDMSPADFFVSRHESVQRDHLHKAQFTLHLDADSLVLNMSRSLEPFLSLNSSVVLQMRENHEITSAIYIVRNDMRAYCFLDYWRRFHPPRTPKDYDGTIIPVPNNCNGALVAAVLHLAAPEIGVLKCLHEAFRLHPRVLDDFQVVMKTRTQGYKHIRISDFKSEGVSGDMVEIKHPYFNPYPEHYCMHKYAMYGYILGTSIDLASFSHGVYVLWPHEGMWRSHEAPNRNESWFVDKFRRCYPGSDLIGHGDKNIASNMYEPNHGTTCDIESIRAGSGSNRHCHWLHGKNSGERDEELAILRKYCAFNSPRCVTSRTYNTSSGVRDSTTAVPLKNLVKNATNTCIVGGHLPDIAGETNYKWNEACWEHKQLIRRQPYRYKLEYDSWN